MENKMTLTSQTTLLSLSPYTGPTMECMKVSALSMPRSRCSRSVRQHVLELQTQCVNNSKYPAIAMTRFCASPQIGAATMYTINKTCTNLTRLAPVVSNIQ